MVKLAELWEHALCPFAYCGHISPSCWEAVLKGRGVQDILSEVSLKGAGVGCCHMLKDEPAVRVGLAEQEPWLEHRRKREVCDLWEERLATQDYVDLVKLCRAKAQVKLNLVTL